VVATGVARAGAGRTGGPSRSTHDGASVPAEVDWNRLIRRATVGAHGRRWATAVPGQRQSTDGDDPDRQIDAGATLCGAVHVLQVQQQSRLVGDQRCCRTEGRCGHRMSLVYFPSSDSDGSHPGQQGDTKIVVMKCAPPKLIPPPAEPWPFRIQCVRARTSPKVSANDPQATTRYRRVAVRRAVKAEVVADLRSGRPG